MDAMIMLIVALVAIALGVGLGYTFKRRQIGNDQLRLDEVGVHIAEPRASADTEKKAILLQVRPTLLYTWPY